MSKVLISTEFCDLSFFFSLSLSVSHSLSQEESGLICFPSVTAFSCAFVWVWVQVAVCVPESCWVWPFNWCLGNSHLHCCCMATDRI